MGQNLERLKRLQSNRSDMFASVFRNVQTVQRKSTAEAIETASVGVQKAARTEGFEGGLGDRIKARLIEIHKDIDAFTEYQAKLNKAITLANEALQTTATGASGIPDGGLTSAQQNTIDMAAKTDSPVQVSPGVTMTPSQATQYYQQQAELAQEEAARKLTAALDARLLEIIGALPVSDYDEKPPSSEDENGGGPGGRRTVSGPGTGGSGGYTGPGVVNPGTNTGIGTNTGGGGDDGSNSTIIRNPPVPPIIREPHHPELPTGYPTPHLPEGPNIDGGTGVIPTPGTGGPGQVGLPGPGGGITGPGGGITAPGGVGGVAGGVAGGLAGGVGRLAGAGGINPAGAINAAPGAGAPGVGAAGGAGAAGSTSRGGMIAAGGHAAAGTGKGGRKNRRRGQDLMAFELEHENDDVIAELGAAGAAGHSDSDGREELGW